MLSNLLPLLSLFSFFPTTPLAEPSKPLTQTHYSIHCHPTSKLTSAPSDGCLAIVSIIPENETVCVPPEREVLRLGYTLGDCAIELFDSTKEGYCVDREDLVQSVERMVYACEDREAYLVNGERRDEEGTRGVRLVKAGEPGQKAGMIMKWQ